MSWGYHRSYLYDEETLEKKGPVWMQEQHIDWDLEFSQLQFSNEFIIKYKNIITDWNACCKFQKLKVNTIRKLAKCVNLNWHEIALRQTLTEKFIEEYQEFMNWEDLSIGQDLSEQLIEKYKDKVDWSEISFKDYLTIPFIRKFKDRIIWKNFSQVYRTHYKNWNFIREFVDYLDWEEIYEHIWERLKKNIKLIREFQDYLPWEQVEEDLVLKKNELREFWDQLTFIYEEDYYDPEIYKKEFKEKMICEEDD